MKRFFKNFIFIFTFIIVGSAWPLFAQTAIPLSLKEEEALRLASEWSNRPIKPIQTSGGKVVYVFGSSMPTIIGSPMQISDIELEAGEVVNEILVGDNSRWMVESGTSGSGVTHVFVKPLDAGLQTSLVVTTNRRTYHMKLISRKSGHTPYVGFLYKSQLMAIVASDQQEQLWNTTSSDSGGQNFVDLSSLDFNYTVKGKARWKPERVYNDGRKTFIRLPDSASTTDIPVLLAMKGDVEQLVNYRVRNNTFEVDGLFDHLTLVSGVGGDQVLVDVKRSIKK